MRKCPACGYWAFNGQECFDCGYRPFVAIGSMGTPYIARAYTWIEFWLWMSEMQRRYS